MSRNLRVARWMRIANESSINRRRGGDRADDGVATRTRDDAGRRGTSNGARGDAIGTTVTRQRGDSSTTRGDSRAGAGRRDGARRGDGEKRDGRETARARW